MNAAVVHSYDQPPRYETFPDPVPSADEVLIDVTAAGLHPIVKSLAKGAHYGSTGQLPLIPGVDGVRQRPPTEPASCSAHRILRTEPSPSARFRGAPCARLCPANLDDVIVAAMINPAMSS